MNRFLVVSLLISLALTAIPQTALATIDCNYPVSSKQWTGQITSGVRLRDRTCMDSNVLGTITGGTTVAILGEADGWYMVKTKEGLKGFVWQDFIKVTSTAGLPDFFSTVVTTEPKTEPVSSDLLTRVKGRILLQVENNGEAWYVRPDDGKRYYMKDGETAYQMMRAFGLGISEADFAKLKAGDYEMKKRLKGKIMLRVELHGEAYYLHPEDGSLHYLQNGNEAYRVMREKSLGITNTDLMKITQSEFEAKLETSSNTTTTTEPKPTTEITYTGEVPAGVDLAALNQYWLGKINALRAERGLRQLVLDQRWVATATEWATYMGGIGVSTHTRPDGKTMHQWIDTKGLDFTVRYSEDGWKSNYFTENIAWGIASDGSTEATKKVLDDTLAFYLSEAPYNGDHYRTIYHADWNSVGLGFYFVPSTYGYKVFVAIHYGSLAL